VASYVFIVSPVDVHLSQAEEGQDEVDGGELGGLVVILERLVVVLLSGTTRTYSRLGWWIIYTQILAMNSL